MKKSLIIGSLFLFTAAAYAGIEMYGSGLIVPAVVDEATVPNAQKGEMVYD